MKPRYEVRWVSTAGWCDCDDGHGTTTVSAEGKKVFVAKYKAEAFYRKLVSTRKDEATKVALLEITTLESCLPRCAYSVI